ncbi:uncharacterized protein BCR38DRAFT_486503 [Pseudomassariella vexata]|uniref:Uncharacterized protein n=1 Tax=Pseudomassariella vexata TaxID=1141098 RepID=A0A1Y2DSH0_9PEZI|nr:uncharacterized protein BCR38DRAFT_486503 [Pseudomassariella vexata]ORY62231.1 hypothetical protein BCR38DRAFT_486503 [Pseudomassariella vexata]
MSRPGAFFVGDRILRSHRIISAGSSTSFCIVIIELHSGGLVAMAIENPGGLKFAREAPARNIEVTNFLHVTQPEGNFVESITRGCPAIHNILATYCELDAGQKLQIFTHGVAFDRGYWDHPCYKYNYRYVDQAMSHSYSTFSLDGTGGPFFAFGGNFVTANICPPLAEYPDG